MKYPNTYVVFDFETTGLDPANCKMLEVGAIKVVDGGIIDRLQFLIRWPEPVPEKITEITGITQQMVDDEGIDPDSAKQKLWGFIQGNILVGHNIYNFDLRFLENFLTDFKLNWPTFIDTAAHAKGKKINVERKFNENYADWVKKVMDTKAFGIKFNIGICCDELGIDKYRKICLI